MLEKRTLVSDFCGFGAIRTSLVDDALISWGDVQLDRV